VEHTLSVSAPTPKHQGLIALPTSPNLLAKARFPGFEYHLAVAIDRMSKGMLTGREDCRAFRASRGDKPHDKW
jgi:hypothetical protein